MAFGIVIIAILAIGVCCLFVAVRAMEKEMENKNKRKE